MKHLIQKFTLIIGGTIICADVATAGYVQIKNLNIPQNINGQSTGAHLQFDNKIYSVPIPATGQTITLRLPNDTYNKIFLSMNGSTPGSMIFTTCNQSSFAVKDNTTLVISASYDTALHCTSQ